MKSEDKPFTKLTDAKPDLDKLLVVSDGAGHTQWAKYRASHYPGKEPYFTNEGGGIFFKIVEWRYLT